MLEFERDSTAEYFGERIGGLPVTEVGAADKNEWTFRCADPIRNSGRAAGSNRAAAPNSSRARVQVES
jgi:hypothetical protein